MRWQYQLLSEVFGPGGDMHWNHSRRWGVLVTACLLKPASGLRSGFGMLVACNNFLYHTCYSCQTGKSPAYVVGCSSSTPHAQACRVASSAQVLSGSTVDGDADAMQCRSSSVQNSGQASEPSSPAVAGGHSLSQLEQENEALREQLEDKIRHNTAVKEQAERYYQDSKGHNSQLQSQLEV